MKKITKWIILVSLMILIILELIFMINMQSSTSKVYAASGSKSDLQLMARAINGEARGEPYEGQVAVRSCYIKSCKKFKISKYDCRSYL